MPLSLEQISDRIEIDDLLTRYTNAIDTKDWSLLDSCFTPDAHLDYTSAGGVAGDYPKVRQWLEKALAPFPMTVHFISNSSVELAGDEARARTYRSGHSVRDGGDPGLPGGGASESDRIRRAGRGRGDRLHGRNAPRRAPDSQLIAAHAHRRDPPPGARSLGQAPGGRARARGGADAGAPQ